MPIYGIYVEISAFYAYTCGLWELYVEQPKQIQLTDKRIHRSR